MDGTAALAGLWCLAADGVIQHLSSYEPVQTAVVPTIRIAQEPVADALLSRDPLALLIGMLLDQHVSRGCTALAP